MSEDKKGTIWFATMSSPSNPGVAKLVFLTQEGELVSEVRCTLEDWNYIDAGMRLSIGKYCAKEELQ